MGVLDREVEGRLVPPALPEAPLRRLVLAAVVRALAGVLARVARAGLEDTVWAVTVRAGCSAGFAAAAAGAAAAGATAGAAAGMAVTGVVAAALVALAWGAEALVAAARDLGVAMAVGDGAR